MVPRPRARPRGDAAGDRSNGDADMVGLSSSRLRRCAGCGALKQALAGMSKWCVCGKRQLRATHCRQSPKGSEPKAIS